MYAFTSSLPILHSLSSRQLSNTSNKKHNSASTSFTIPKCLISDSSISSKSQLLDSISDRLREELPTLFSPTENPDYSLYAADVIFEDPLNKFRGIKRYAANINFLNSSPVFSNAQLYLYDIATLVDQSTVRTRWALEMSPNLPWNPCIAFTGQSDYVVDEKSTKVIRHIDYWDSLENSQFFSWEGVQDLLKQCKPTAVGPSDFGGFTLLRRTDTIQIRRFEEGKLGLTKLKNTSIDTWIPQSDETKQMEQNEQLVFVKDVAVIPLTNQNPTNINIQQTVTMMKKYLEDKPYATAGTRAFYVTSRIRGSDIKEVWLELEEAKASVDR